MSDSQPSSTYFTRINRSQSNLDDIFRCFICLGNVVDAKLCPCCSKLCCNQCILKWLTEQRQQCPHCRSPLRPHNLVNCRFVNEITQAIEKITNSSADSTEKCQSHNTPLNYFCKTCDTAICADCAMFEQVHKNHEFLHLQEIYETHVANIRQKASGLRQRLKDLSLLQHQVNANIEKIRLSKDERNNELIITLEQMQARLEAMFKSKLLTLHSQRSAISEEVEYLENMHCEINRLLSQSGKSALIAKSVELVNMIQEIHEKPITSFQRSPVSAEFPSEIVPEYDMATFELENFAQIRQNSEVIYSEPMQSNNLTWRLKVYPNGNGVARSKYLSIFLEMIKGPPDSSKYEYKVEMINHQNQSLSITREFASEFEPGECWGYNRFFKIDQLQEKGYLDEKGSLLLKYYVRAPTFAQHCRDQQLYIEQLERNKIILQSQLKEMRDKAQLKELSPRVHSSSENPLEQLTDEEEQKNNVNYIDETDKWQESSCNTSEQEQPDLLQDQLQNLNEVLRSYMMSPEAVSSTESSPERAYEQIWRISRSDGEISESEVIHEELYSQLTFNMVVALLIILTIGTQIQVIKESSLYQSLNRQQADLDFSKIELDDTFFYGLERSDMFGLSFFSYTYGNGKYSLIQLSAAQFTINLIIDMQQAQYEVVYNAEIFQLSGQILQKSWHFIKIQYQIDHFKYCIKIDQVDCNQIDLDAPFIPISLDLGTKHNGVISNLIYYNFEEVPWNYFDMTSCGNNYSSVLCNDYLSLSYWEINTQNRWWSNFYYFCEDYLANHKDFPFQNQIQLTGFYKYIQQAVLDIITIGISSKVRIIVKQEESNQFKIESLICNILSDSNNLSNPFQQNQNKYWYFLAISLQANDIKLTVITLEGETITHWYYIEDQCFNIPWSDQSRIKFQTNDSQLSQWRLYFELKDDQQLYQIMQSGLNNFAQDSISIYFFVIDSCQDQFSLYLGQCLPCYEGCNKPDARYFQSCKECSNGYVQQKDHQICLRNCEWWQLPNSIGICDGSYFSIFFDFAKGQLESNGYIVHGITLNQIYLGQGIRLNQSQKLQIIDSPSLKLDFCINLIVWCFEFGEVYTIYNNESIFLTISIKTQIHFSFIMKQSWQISDTISYLTLNQWLLIKFCSNFNQRLITLQVNNDTRQYKTSDITIDIQSSYHEIGSNSFSGIIHQLSYTSWDQSYIVQIPQFNFYSISQSQPICQTNCDLWQEQCRGLRQTQNFCEQLFCDNIIWFGLSGTVHLHDLQDYEQQEILSQCQELCGDGVHLGEFECDDGNFDNNDGCNELCQIENGYICQVNLFEQSHCIKRQNELIYEGWLLDEVLLTYNEMPIQLYSKYDTTFRIYQEGKLLIKFENLVMLPFKLHYSYDGQSQQSILIDPRCQVVKDQECQQCISKFELQNGECTCQGVLNISNDCICDQGFFMDNNCNQCSPNCKSCIEANQCQQCNEFLFLIEGQCFKCEDIEGFGLDWQINFTQINDLKLIQSLCSEACGDGILFEQNECDDGNNIDGDGCSSDCLLEDGYKCTILGCSNTKITSYIEYIALNDNQYHLKIVFDSQIVVMQNLQENTVIEMKNIKFAYSIFYKNKKLIEQIDIFINVESNVDINQLVQVYFTQKLLNQFGFEAQNHYKVKVKDSYSTQFSQTIQLFGQFSQYQVAAGIGAIFGAQLCGLQVSQGSILAAVEVMQIIYYLLFINLEFSIELQNFMRQQSVLTLNLSFDFLQTFYSANDSIYLRKKYEEEDVDSNILVNSGFCLSWSAILLITIIILHKFQKLKKVIYQKVFIRYTLSTLMPVHFAALLQLYYLEYKGIISVLVYTLIALSSCLELLSVYILLLKITLCRNKQEIFEKYSDIVEGLQLKGRLRIGFIFVQNLRNLMLITCIVIFQRAIDQTNTLFIIQFIYLLYLVIFTPFKRRFTGQLVNTFQEIGLLLNIGLFNIISRFQFSIQTQNQFYYFILLGFNGIIVLQLLVFYISLTVSVFNALYEKIKARRRNNQIKSSSVAQTNLY